MYNAAGQGKARGDSAAQPDRVGATRCFVAFAMEQLEASVDKWRGGSISGSGHSQYWRSYASCGDKPERVVGWPSHWDAFNYYSLAGASMVRDEESICMEMIVCRDVHFGYLTGAGEVTVLRGVDVTVEKGEHVAIVGPSGAGKSTFLRLCAAQAWPTKGEVHIGNDIVTNKLRGSALASFRREQVGLVFQQFSLLPTLTALENVMLPLLPYCARRPLRQRAVSLLEEVGLEARTGHYPSQLSGGEQQRVAIARALIASPPLLLADEPTGSLDATTGLQVIRLLDRLCREHDCTLVVVTHDTNIAAFADKRLKMVDGCLEEMS